MVDMMKKVLHPAREVEEVERTLCDICGHDVGPSDAYDVREVEVKCHTGTSYPEGGSGEDIKVDLCVDCFRGKLVPWLQSLGVPCHVTEWDW